MFYELARAAVQRVFQDKILMGLVIVLVLAILVGGFGGSGSEKAERSAPTGPREANVPPPPENRPSAGVEPKLATEFISWWLGSAMDFNPQTAQAHHSEAIAWMTPETVQAFQANFWPPEFAEGIASGRIMASFTPTGIQAVAANPDGSVVVTATGTLMMQAGPQPVQHQFVADFLVRKEQDSLRVSGIYNRTVASAGRIY